jgi:ankyrin repeat protein
VEYNSVDIVRVLIEYGVNINAQDANNRTALHIAVDMQVESPVLLPHLDFFHSLQHIHCAALLLRAGADLTIQDAKALLLSNPFLCVELHSFS